ncbi:AraC family transcriptional regulator [Bacterioplanes sanyensis]|uniref:AraC family transcriptional regulator n=1 Tax=Bacterioplanes sanyensis TaxID=1249553 RepID=A0A222FFX6_9GAMM|nr:AraC family transcriptional regulator [Bacterioplanes sanyensis]ASP37670.1 AraC family transcriptional regulator [Bacterioplanes sanyensis]
MSSAIRVNGSWIRLLADWLDRHQLAAPGIRAQIAQYQPSDAVPIEYWQHLLNQAFALRPQQTNQALEVAQGVTLTHVGVLGYLVVACDHLGQAMATYQRFETLFYGRPLASLESHGDQAGIYWQPEQHLPEAEEIGLCALVYLARQHIDAGTALPLQQVSFCHQPGAAQLHAMEAFFDCPVIGGAQRSGLTFHASALMLPLRNSEPGLRKLLEEQASAMLKALPEPDEFERQLQAQLVRQLPDGHVSLDTAARQLHCSVRTLQRRLHKRQLHWQGLVERTREQLARQYLCDPGLSLLDIALLLGYRDQSTFTRSFKRWSGMTPSAFRKQHLSP